MVMRRPIQGWCVFSRSGYLFLCDFMEEKFRGLSFPFREWLFFGDFTFQYRIKDKGLFLKIMEQDTQILNTNFSGIRAVENFPEDLNWGWVLNDYLNWLYKIAKELDGGEYR
jgi:hypothetical protein